MELSSKIKAMKFMKRKEDAEDRKQQEAQQRELAQQGHWKLAPTSTTTTAKPKFKVEYDFAMNSGKSSSGRQSFGEFNLETERLNSEEKVSQMKKATTVITKNVSDLEMSEAISTSGNKRRLE